MANSQYGFNWTNIGTLGTTLLTDRTTNLVRVVIPGTYVGSVIVHDAAATAGTTATSAIATIGLPATGIPNSIEIGARCAKGLVYQATGTPIMVLIWD